MLSHYHIAIVGQFNMFYNFSSKKSQLQYNILFPKLLKKVASVLLVGY